MNEEKPKEMPLDWIDKNEYWHSKHIVHKCIYHVIWTTKYRRKLFNTNEMQKKLISAELRLKELKSKKRPTVKEAANLIGMITYRNIRNPSMIPSIVGTLVAGVNEDGTTALYTVEPAGTAMKVDDFDANFGSGMPFVLGLLERQYKKDLTVEQGVELIIEALKSSTQRDMGSGYGIDVFTIQKEGIKHEIAKEITPEYKDKSGNKR